MVCVLKSISLGFDAELHVLSKQVAFIAEAAEDLWHMAVASFEDVNSHFFSFVSALHTLTPEIHSETNSPLLAENAQSRSVDFCLGRRLFLLIQMSFDNMQASGGFTCVMELSHNLSEPNSERCLRASLLRR